jgi:hypothetical protein
MDTANTSYSKNRAAEPTHSGRGGRETAATSIRYVGRKEARVPLYLVLVILAALAVAIVAVQHYYVQA